VRPPTSSCPPPASPRVRPPRAHADGAYRKRRIEDTRVLQYDGPVYNIEVEEDQTYLVQGAAVHNCQNWLTSQALRDPRGVPPQRHERAASWPPARQHGARIVTSTYNEPLITSEWAVAVFREARAAGLVCSYVSNGNGTPEVLDYIQPWSRSTRWTSRASATATTASWGHAGARALDDPRAARARHLGGDRDPARARLQRLGRGAHGHRALPRLRLTGHPVARDRVPQGLQDDGPEDTSVRTLLRAAETGAREGLRFVYAGNIPGAVGEWENTRCPGCRAVLVERAGSACWRTGFPDGVCPSCRARVPGFWEPDARALATP
jgi:pyruvate formate lyase activating enzyme